VPVPYNCAFEALLYTSYYQTRCPATRYTLRCGLLASGRNNPYEQAEHDYAVFGSSTGITDQLTVGRGLGVAGCTRALQTRSCMVPAPQPTAASYLCPPTCKSGRKILGVANPPGARRTSYNSGMPSAQISYKFVSIDNAVCDLRARFPGRQPNQRRIRSARYRYLYAAHTARACRCYEVGFKSNLFRIICV